MLLRMIYDDALAQAAYLIGCQKTGEAIVIDPERDVDRYESAAAKEGLRLVAAAETHIHADFLSGSRELAERGAKVYLSDEGDKDWKYQWLDKKSGGGSYAHRLLRHGDTFNIGQIEFRVVHTPGHTPEHISLLVTDRGGGAAEPMGIATGDFVFVGDLGRPDLLETAAGQAGAKEPSAHRLFASVTEFVKLPDYLQVWPAHGAGSACGKALGSVPQTTVGYERRFNPAIRAATSERGFVEFILDGQPDPPLYFARMKRDNKAGPPLLAHLPRPARLSPSELAALDAHKAAVIDTRPWKAFRSGHIPGSLYIPLGNTFPTVAGSFIAESDPIVLIVEEAKLEQAVRLLVRIGLDRITGFAPPEDLEAHQAAGGRLTTSQDLQSGELREMLDEPGLVVLDVRNTSEFKEGHISGALNVPYTRLAARLEEVPRNARLVLYCGSGSRSARAVAFLQRAGYRAANLAGGILAWQQQTAELIER